MGAGSAPGLNPVFHDSHRAWLCVAAILSLVYSFLGLGARLYGKWGLLWYDDVILAAAYVFAVAQWGTLFKAISIGRGVSSSLVSADLETKLAELLFSSRILLLISLCLAKVSTLAFTRRIFSGNLYKEKLLFAATLGFIVFWGVLAVLLSSAACTPSAILLGQENTVCAANVRLDITKHVITGLALTLHVQAARWKVITALDVLTEVVLVALPTYLVSRHEIKSGKKRIVIFVFSFRLMYGSCFKCLSGEPEKLTLAASPPSSSSRPQLT
ncbi:hypothetical protein LTR28_005736 [Elasticomyces elasticus]|nr:hypothetical protein LTR28_005736 [Elasticomyces elasticus]